MFYTSHTEVVANAWRLVALPISTVVDFAFSLSPSDVVHPYTVKGESLEEYSTRLDKQPDADVWETTRYALHGVVYMPTHIA